MLRSEMSFINLPSDVQKYILSYLDIFSLCNLTIASKTILKIILPSLIQQQETLLRNPSIRMVGGRTHCFIGYKSDHLYAFGENSYGQLGLEHKRKCDFLTPIPNIPGKIQQVVTAEKHTFILTSEGLFACGDNTHGQLGLGHNNNCNIINQVPKLFGTIQQVIVGYEHTFMLTSKGLFACGTNTHGQLGLGHNNHCNTFTHVSNDALGTIQRVIISGKPSFMGSGASTYVVSDQGLFTCGNNSYGQLGLGHNNNCNTLTRIPNILGKIQQICADAESVLVLTDEGLLACGLNGNGQLGLGHIKHCNTLTRVPNIPGTIRQVFAGELRTFVLTDKGLFACGFNAYGQLGIANNILTDKHALTPVVNVPGEIKKLIIDGYKTFMQTDQGLFICGDNREGSLGLGHNQNCYTLALIPKLSGTIQQIISNRGFTLALTDQGVFVLNSNFGNTFIRLKDLPLAIKQQLQYYARIKHIIKSADIFNIGLNNKEIALFILTTGWVRELLNADKICQLATSHIEIAKFILTNAYLSTKLTETNLIEIAKHYSSENIYSFFFTQNFLLRKLSNQTIEDFGIAHKKVAHIILSSSLADKMSNETLVKLIKAHPLDLSDLIIKNRKLMQKLGHYQKEYLLKLSKENPSLIDIDTLRVIDDGWLTALPKPGLIELAESHVMLAILILVEKTSTLTPEEIHTILKKHDHHFLDQLINFSQDAFVRLFSCRKEDFTKVLVLTLASSLDLSELATTSVNIAHNILENINSHDLTYISYTKGVSNFKADKLFYLAKTYPDKLGTTILTKPLLLQKIEDQQIMNLLGNHPALLEKLAWDNDNKANSSSRFNEGFLQKLILNYYQHYSKPFTAQALSVAIKRKYITIVKILLEQGINPNEEINCEDLSFSPLQLAILNGEEIIANLLLKSGANINAVIKHKGGTLLHLAAETNNIKLATFLLNHGANSSLKNDAYQSPKEIAQAKNHTEIVTLLNSPSNYVKHAAIGLGLAVVGIGFFAYKYYTNNTDSHPFTARLKLWK